MMKIDFPLPTDGKMHRFCIACRAEGATKSYINGQLMLTCPTCGQTNDRAIYFNEHEAWLDDTKELWHGSAMVFVRNKEKKFLFFKRTGLPFVLSVPAGHTDRGEKPFESARRELLEETGLNADHLRHIASVDMYDNSCSAGADAHRTDAFLYDHEDSSEVNLSDEGEATLWMDLDDALAQGATKQDTYMIKHFKTELLT